MRFLSSSIVVFASSLFTSEGLELRRASSDRNLQTDEEKFLDPIILWANPDVNACMLAKGVSRRSDVILSGDECTNFYVDDNYGNAMLVRAFGDDGDLCLQAGHGKSLRDGSKMRLYPCDENNIFQRFAADLALEPGPLRLVSDQYDDLCVTHRGVNANLGKDPIIFKKCDLPDSRILWSFD